ncbi:hypothetical protein FBU30_002832 [Linnemannia zychae]|nr:hypothetical protein FBU30_002832 [Linnemannia zychae]
MLIAGDDYFAQPLRDSTAALAVAGSGIESNSPGELRDSSETPSKHRPSIASLKPATSMNSIDHIIPHKGSNATLDEKIGAFVKLKPWTTGEEGASSSNPVTEIEANKKGIEKPEVEDSNNVGEGSDPGRYEYSHGSISANKLGDIQQPHVQRLQSNRVEFTEHAQFRSAAPSIRTLDPDKSVNTMSEHLETSLATARTTGGPSSGAHRKLECYMFFLPIRVLRSRITSLLSHWTMATLILIPEAHAFLAVDSIDGRSTSYLMLSMAQVQDENTPTIRVAACHVGTLLIRFPTQSRLDGWMGLFTEEDLQALAAQSPSAPSSGSSTLPYVTGYSENLNGGGGIGGAGTLRRSSVPSSQSVHGLENACSAPFVDVIPARNDRTVNISDSTMITNSDSSKDAQGEGKNRRNRLSNSDDKTQRPTSWISRLGSEFSLLWNLKGSSITTNGATTSAAYDEYNIHPKGYPKYYIDGSHISGGDGRDEDGPGAPQWSHPGGEWPSIDSNNSGFAQLGHGQSRWPGNYQPPFGDAPGAVIEDREGETKSSEHGSQTIVVPNDSKIPIEEPLSTNKNKASSLTAESNNDAITNNSGSNYFTIRYENSATALNGDPVTSSHSKDILHPSTVSIPPLHPTSSQSISSQLISPWSLSSEVSRQGCVHSFNTLSTSAIYDDDDDDLYDPEFGIGRNGRRRRHRSRFLGGSITAYGNHAVIPSAAVISAAAAAVSAGWSESDALAAAMANPPVPLVPGGGEGPGSISSVSRAGAVESSHKNRARHDPRSSQKNPIRLSRIGRQESTSENYSCNESSNPLASASISSNITNADAAGGEGNSGHISQALNERISMTPITTTKSSDDLGSPPLSSVVAPLAMYSTSADMVSNSSSASQINLQQQQQQQGHQQGPRR